LRYKATRPLAVGATELALSEGRAHSALPGIAYLDSAAVAPLDRVVVVHLAYPTALFALAPLAWLVGHRKRRRRAARVRGGLCASCAYDLRASPGRCPECGASAELRRDHHGGHGEHATP
jgi:hypothetical protein